MRAIGQADAVGETAMIKPLAMSANYYLSEDHTVSGIKELLTQIFLLVVCVSGAYLYWDPAYAYSKRVGLPGLAPLYIVGTCFPALAVLYVSTDIFFKLHFRTNIPNALKDVLVSPQTRVQRYGENFLIAFLSLLSSTPLASVIFAFPPKNMPLWCVFILATIILIDNTILHFLPVKLVLTQSIYRLPILPFEYLTKWLLAKCRDRKLTPLDKGERAYNTQMAKDWMGLKMLIIQRIALAQQRLTQQSFTWKWSTLQYDVKVPENIRDLTDSNDALDLLLSFLPEGQAPNACWQFLGKLNTHLQKGVSILGAIWIWSCCMGYYAGPVNQFQKLIHPYVNSTVISYTVAAGISVLPDYNLSVLLAFFGVNFLGGLYKYMTTWGKNVMKIPMEVKLFPKLFLATMGLNVVFAGFSYAAAVELVYSNFTGDWAQSIVLPLFVVAAVTGISFAGFMAVRNFFMLMFLKVATHLSGKYTRFLGLGNEEVKLLTKTTEKFNQYSNSVMYMDGEKLKNELSDMSQEQRQKLLGIDETAYEKMIDHKTNLQKNKDGWPCFDYCRKGQEGERDPLVGPGSDYRITV